MGDKRMTEEEYFRKNYPDFCYGDKPLSPYWDLFQDGVEFGERQSEKTFKQKLKVETELSKRLGVAYREYEQLTKEQDEHIVELEKENAELKSEKGCETCTKFDKVKLTKATEIIKDILNVCCSNCTNPHCVDCKHRKMVLKAEQFLQEIEK